MFEIFLKIGSFIYQNINEPFVNLCLGLLIGFILGFLHKEIWNIEENINKKI